MLWVSKLGVVYSLPTNGTRTMPKKRKIPNVSRRGDRWQVRFTDSRRTPSEVSFGFDASLHSATSIQRVRDQLYRARDTGWDPWTKRLPWAAAQASGYTINEGAKLFCQEKRTAGQRGQKGGWTHKTMRNYEGVLGQLARHVGTSTRIHQVTTEQLADFIYADHLSEASKKNRYTHIKSFMGWVGEEAPAMPERPAVRRKLVEYITEDELMAICRAHIDLCHQQQARKHAPKRGTLAPTSRLWYTDAWMFAFYQALRPGEIAAQRVGNINLKRSTMRVGDDLHTPKGKDEKLIPLTPKAEEIARAYMYENGKLRPPKARLFSRKVYKPLTVAFKRAREEVLPNRPKVSMKTLRASGGTYWRFKGIDPGYIRDLLRHKSITTTETYYEGVDIDRTVAVFQRASEQ
ncbi:MAG: site-specific integrase [Bacteroidota bacterium]